MEGVAPAFSSGTPRQSGSSSFPAAVGPFFPPITARATYQNSKLLASATGTGAGGGGQMTELVKGGRGGGLNLFLGGQWGRKLGLFESGSDTQELCESRGQWPSWAPRP